MKVFLRWHQRKAEFRYPSQPVPRTAVLEPWFVSGSSGQVRIFEPHQLEPELERFAPQAIAASWHQLDQLLRSSQWQGRIALTHAVVVLHRATTAATLPAPLTARDRDWVWQAFRVPIFEQVIGPRGLLLAGECAAHEGMHIESPSIQPNGYVGDSPCGCGRSTPRLRAEQPAERLRAAAASAC